MVPCPRIVSFFVNWSGQDPRLDLRLSISGSLGSYIILFQVDARQLRCLFDQVIPGEEWRRNPKARKLKKTIESIQADREILLHKNMGHRRAIFLEKRKRKRQGPLKNYLLDPEDVEQRALIVFSPAKIQRSRERKAEIEAQEQAEEACKEREKVERKLRKERQEVEKRQRQRRGNELRRRDRDRKRKKNNKD